MNDNLKLIIHNKPIFSIDITLHLPPIYCKKQKTPRLLIAPQKRKQSGDVGRIGNRRNFHLKFVRSAKSSDTSFFTKLFT